VIPQDKIREICERLLAKSRTNRVNWLHVGEKRYGVQLPAGGIQIGFFSPQTEPDEIHVAVTGPDGRSVGEWTVSQADDDQWPLFWDLYHDAERCITGWDQVLNGIEAAIGSEDTIGLAKPLNLPVDDIPY
jgi:hypothetical protein